MDVILCQRTAHAFKVGKRRLSWRNEMSNSHIRLLAVKEEMQGAFQIYKFSWNSLTVELLDTNGHGSDEAQKAGAKGERDRHHVAAQD